MLNILKSESENAKAEALIAEYTDCQSRADCWMSVQKLLPSDPFLPQIMRMQKYVHLHYVFSFYFIAQRKEFTANVL